MNSQRIPELIVKSLLGQLQSEDKTELQAYLDEDERLGQMYAKLNAEGTVGRELDRMYQVDAKKAEEAMSKRLNIKSKSNVILKWLSAAAITTFIAGAGFALLHFHFKDDGKQINETPSTEVIRSTARTLMDNSQGSSTTLRQPPTTQSQ